MGSEGSAPQGVLECTIVLNEERSLGKSGSIRRVPSSVQFVYKSYFFPALLSATSGGSRTSGICSVDTFLMHVSSSLEGGKVRGASWKLRKECVSVVIKAEMNDGFRDRGVDRLDDRGAEGPLQF